MVVPALTASVAAGALIGWMLILTAKHVVADFFLQTKWMAVGKDSPTGWAWPLLAHCLVHGVLSTALIAALAPSLWFLGLVDFAIHLIIDRAKGWCVVTFRIAPGHRWFWWLIGIDQALHHLTGFGLAIVLAANA